MRTSKQYETGSAGQEMEKILPFKCLCGGTMKESLGNVEFFGIDFGLKKIEVCTKCGEEYISDGTMKEIKKKSQRTWNFWFGKVS